MKLMSIVFTFLFFCISIQAQHHIIPEPVNYDATNEVFTIDTELEISLSTTDDKAKNATTLFQTHLEQLGIATAISAKKAKNGLQLVLNKKPNKTLGDEGYKLEVKSKQMTLKANTAAGLFNGFQTLKQLLPASKMTAGFGSSWALAAFKVSTLIPEPF